MHDGEGGERTPFFLVAGMFGNVLNLRHLARLLGTDRPFYGLQARGLYGDQAPHDTFERRPPTASPRCARSSRTALPAWWLLGRRHHRLRDRPPARSGG
jgi:hypothetical protein